MASKGFIDDEGLAVLWERIKQLVYACGGNGGGGVTYTLQSDGETLTLVGSDGSTSSVDIKAKAVCDNVVN